MVCIIRDLRIHHLRHLSINIIIIESGIIGKKHRQPGYQQSCKNQKVSLSDAFPDTILLSRLISPCPREQPLQRQGKKQCLYYPPQNPTHCGKLFQAWLQNSMYGSVIFYADPASHRLTCCQKYCRYPYRISVNPIPIVPGCCLLRCSSHPFLRMPHPFSPFLWQRVLYLRSPDMPCT